MILEKKNNMDFDIILLFAIKSWLHVIYNIFCLFHNSFKQCCVILWIYWNRVTKLIYLTWSVYSVLQLNFKIHSFTFCVKAKWKLFIWKLIFKVQPIFCPFHQIYLSYNQQKDFIAFYEISKNMPWLSQLENFICILWCLSFP